MEDRAVEAGIGVDGTAGVVDFARDVSRFAPFGALEDHVFHGMGEAGAEVFLLVDGSGADPELYGHDRRRGIFAEQADDAVVEDRAFQAGVQVLQAGEQDLGDIR